MNLLGASIQQVDGAAHVQLDYNQGLLVLHPDILLSGARLSGAMAYNNLHASK